MKLENKIKKEKPRREEIKLVKEIEIEIKINREGEN